MFNFVQSWVRKMNKTKKFINNLLTNANRLSDKNEDFWRGYIEGLESVKWFISEFIEKGEINEES